MIRLVSQPYVQLKGFRAELREHADYVKGVGRAGKQDLVGDRDGDLFMGGPFIHLFVEAFCWASLREEPFGRNGKEVLLLVKKLPSGKWRNERGGED